MRPARYIRTHGQAKVCKPPDGRCQRMEEKENHTDDPSGSGAEVAKSRKQLSSSLKSVGAQKAAASCKRKFQSEADGSSGLESCLRKKRFCGRHRGQFTRKGLAARLNSVSEAVRKRWAKFCSRRQDAEEPTKGNERCVEPTTARFATGRVSPTVPSRSTATQHSSSESSPAIAPSQGM